MAKTKRKRNTEPKAPVFDPSFRPRAYRWPRASSVSRTTAALDATEIILARIVLATPHRDAIALRARRTTDGRIRYRMIHESGSAPARRIRIKPIGSAEPLTFGQIVDLLDGAYYDGACADEHDQGCFGRVIWGTLALHFEHGVAGADEYLHFATIDSPHYPQLHAYYRERLAEWCLERCEEEEDCGKVVRMRMRRG